MVFLLAMCTFYTAFAQNRQITGKVTSSDDGSALPGVSVKLKGTNLGTVTDVNGVFKISASNSSVLTFSFIGYTSQDVSVGSASNLTVRLAPDARTLAEVNVVSVGYGTQKRKDLSGSISSVTAAQIEEVPVTSLDQALQGRASGVQVINNDASPGGNVSVLIRGVGSLAPNGNGPLYVIDGYPLDNGGLNNINPNDIASIDVLKDASATAIYGIRAANGVVLVTTKKGKKDGVVVTFDAFDAFQSKPKEYKVLNADQFATLYNTVAADPTQTLHLQPIPVFANPAALHNVDWQNAIYKTGLTQSYSLSFRGGTDKVQSASSVGYYAQQGIVTGSWYKRFTLSTNTDYEPVKWLKSSTSFKYTNSRQNTPFGGLGSSNLELLSETPPTLDGGNQLTYQIKDANGNYGFFNPTNTYSQIKGYGNPLYGIQNNRTDGLNGFLLANTSLEATIFDGLKFKTFAGVNISNSENYYYSPEDDRAANQYPGSQVQNAFYNQHINQTFNWDWANTLTYDKTFGKHAINVIAGTEEEKTIWDGMGGQGIPPNAYIRDLSQVTQLVLDANNPPGSNSGNGQNIYTLQSYFGRATYQFDNKYIINGTVRRDGSSKFPANNQYGTFPSGSVAWKVKQESFLKNTTWLTDLKLRGSYGATGNQGTIIPFQYQQLFSTGHPASYAPGGGISADNLGYPFNKLYQSGTASVQGANSKLKWETDYQTDIGVDAAFLNGDLTVTADWFNRKSKDFLLTLSAPAQTGYNTFTQNVGSADNKGLEVAINYNHKINSDVSYGIALTVTTVSNKLTSLTSGANTFTNYGGFTPTGDGWGTFSNTTVGGPIGEFYGYKSLGVIQTQAQLNALNANAVAKQGAGAFYETSVTQPGDRLFADINGDGIVNALDRTAIGNPQPKFYGGLDLTTTYKSWDFNAYFYGVYGNKIFDNAESTLESFQNRNFVGVENVSLQYYNNYWTPSRPSNTFTRVEANDDVQQNLGPSTAYIQNGSFLKLKTFTVGYTLPGAFARKIAVNKVRFYVSSQNLFTITSYKGLDPEVGLIGGSATQAGVDSGTYPSSKYYTIGVDVTL